jgi:serine/threonine protein kinase/tetratricopeptide (TPR) repeat protein
VESSPVPSPSDEAREQVEAALDALGLAKDELPHGVFERMLDRARMPGSRLAVGRYLVVGELGRGGMGVVYEGWDPGIERRVAIKTVEPDLVPEEDREEVVERFRRETKVVGRLKHRAIVTVFDSGRERAKDPVSGRRFTALYYYVMEYLEGRSLARVLREQDRLPEVEAVRIAADIAEALQLSHDAGIIHRDIKPSNIFLRNGEEAVLLDFGIAKSGNVALTRQGQILGTPSYLAPERLREKEVAIDGRADVFSLGVLLYTMLTGQAPFVGDDVYDTIDKITRAAHRPLEQRSSTTAALAEILDRMLAKRPEDRFASAGSVAEALQGVLRQLEAAELAHVFAEEDSDEHDLEKTSPSAPTPMAPSRTAPDEDTGRIEADPEPDTFDRQLTPVALDAEPAPSTALLDGIPAAHEDVGDTPALGMTAQDQEATPEAPVKVADVLGTRPDLALMRETRELVGKKRPTLADLDDFAEPALENTSPSIPPGHLLALTASALDEDEAYADHAPENDEATDDETVADPHFRVPSQIRNQPVVRAHQRLIATEQVVRAAHPDHADLATEAAVASVRGAPVRSRRSRIEASLVDEDDVVVKPAPLDALNPDELPTQTHFEIPGESGGAEVLDADLIHTRDALIVDPAESQPDRPSPLPDGAANLRARERELSEPAGASPELDLPKSAAVARRTIGPAPGPARISPQVRVKGDPVLEGFERSRLMRKRVVLLIAATLASVALGLALGRLKRVDPPEPPRGGLVPEEEPAVVAEPRDGVRAQPGGQGELELVRPRPAAELIKDAEAARLSGHLDDAARLFEAAIRAAPDGSALRAKAVLGRADVLRQLGEQEDAVRLYRMVAKGHPDSPEAEQARVALDELGRPLRRRRPDAPPEPGAAPAPPAPAPAPPTAATPMERCRDTVRAHLSSPREAIRALTALADELPRESCVYWYLGNKHEQVDDYGAAVRAYEKYLALDPKSPRRAAVERKITDLKARLR